MKTKQKFPKSIIFVLAFIIIVSCSTSIGKIEASLPDISNKPDGLYRGDYNLSGTPVKVILDVTVKNKIITAIKIIKHSSSSIGKKAEKITDQIIARQSLDVDAISGATGSSKAILKAVENALQ